MMLCRELSLEKHHGGNSLAFLTKKNRQSLKGLPVGCVFPVDDSAKVESSSVSRFCRGKTSPIVTGKL